jgi:HrpA-like RNA helicase
MAAEWWSLVLATIRIPLTDAEIKWYLSDAMKTHATPFDIKRQFSTQEDSSRAAPSEYHRRHGVFRDLQPQLSKILQNSRVVILGEPGAGKSTEAQSAVRHLIGPRHTSHDQAGV